jgi:hypothetical protein
MRDFEDILDSLDLEVDDNSILPPPNTKEVSVCVFCSYPLFENEVEIGYMESVISGYYCSSCGLKYQFKPKAKVIK